MENDTQKAECLSWFTYHRSPCGSGNPDHIGGIEQTLRRRPAEPAGSTPSQLGPSASSQVRPTTSSPPGPPSLQPWLTVAAHCGHWRCLTIPHLGRSTHTRHSRPQASARAIPSTRMPFQCSTSEQTSSFLLPFLPASSLSPLGRQPLFQTFPGPGASVPSPGKH